MVESEKKRVMKIESYAKQKSYIELVSSATAIATWLIGLELQLKGISSGPTLWVPLGIFLGLLTYYLLMYRLERKFDLVTSWRSYVSFNFRFLLLLFSSLVILLPVESIFAEYTHKLNIVIIRAIGFIFTSIWAAFALPRFVLWIFKPRKIKDKELASRVRDLSRKMGIKVQGIMRIPTPGLARVNGVQVGGLGGSRFVFLIGDWDRDFTTRQILAVIGHELAHAKFHHLATRIAALGTTVLYLLLAYLPLWLVPSLKAQRILSFPPTPRLIMGILVLIGWFFLNLKIFAFFRHHELEADAESARICGAQAVISALQKSAEKNLIPEGKSGLFATHPSIQERVKNLQGKFSQIHTSMFNKK